MAPAWIHSSTAVAIANFALFQTAWLCNVMNLPYWEWISLFVSGGAHLYWVSYLYGTPKLGREILWLIGVGVLGGVVEALFIQIGVLQFGKSALAPYWLINVWLVFATTFRFSLLPLIQRPLLLAFCAPLACLSYWGGVELNGDAQFGMRPLMALFVIAVAWSVLLPTLAWVFRRYVL